MSGAEGKPSVGIAPPGGSIAMAVVPSQILLASRSARRTALLDRIGVRHRVIGAGGVIERERDEDLAPSELVEFNARAKAQRVALDWPGEVVLGADTLVFLDGEPLGKPRDLAEARRMLSRLSGRVHEVITGVCLCGPGSGRMTLFHDCTRIRFRPLGAREIAAYLARVEVLDKAGAYALQDCGGMLVEQIEGSPSNVVGLPLERLQQVLRAQGWGGLMTRPEGARLARSGTWGELGWPEEG